MYQCTSTVVSTSAKPRRRPTKCLNTRLMTMPLAEARRGYRGTNVAKRRLRFPNVPVVHRPAENCVKSSIRTGDERLTKSTSSVTSDDLRKGVLTISNRFLWVTIHREPRCWRSFRSWEASRAQMCQRYAAC